jgi:hypothetical protein
MIAEGLVVEEIEQEWPLVEGSKAQIGWVAQDGLRVDVRRVAQSS